jgi:site-specific DNA-methyltransferase (adenine-specific)
VGHVRVVLNAARVGVVEATALELLGSLRAKSVGIVLTDPPYGDHVHANLGKERRNDGRAARDALEFPPIDDAAIAALAAEFVRVCDGWILIFSDFYCSAKWGQALERAGGAWVRTGQWVKTSPMPQMTGDRPACGCEDIVVGHASPRGWSWNGKGHAAVWRGPRDADAEHPNQKPLWLMQSLLGMFAPARSTVVDPFLGSGATALAALASTRFAGEIGVETACRACAKKRAEEYAPPLPVDLSVFGGDADPRWANRAVERILAASPTLIAA